eukprot:g2540.t1
MTSEANTNIARSLRQNLLAGSFGIFLLFGGVGVWAASTELSSAVIAAGVLVIDGKSKKIQHPDGGIIAELLVVEGQSVSAGETLLRMDDTATRASLSAVEKSITQLLARQARLEAEQDGLDVIEIQAELQDRLDGKEAHQAIARERRLFIDRRVSRNSQKVQLQKRIQQIEEQINGLNIQQKAKAKEIELIGKELVAQRKLFAKGLTPLNKVNNLDRNTARLEGERGSLIAAIAAAASQISEIELQILQIEQDLRTEVATEIRDTVNKIAALYEEEITARDRLKHTEVKSPISGVVHMLSIHTVGGVVTAAETLMDIVPRATNLTVEARVPPQDIDQIAVGQTTSLHMTSFNRNTTPVLKGEVSRVSADLEKDRATDASFYRIAITTPDEEIQRLPEGLVLVPGGDDTADGSDYNDSIRGGDGNDTIYGNDGHDVLYGDSGIDRLYGDNGEDTLRGGDDKDYLYGGNDDDWLWGDDGNDELYGQSGDDTLVGGNGNDLMSGGTGDDLFFGDAGNDEMHGQAGNDRLWGGAGNDVYVFDGQGLDFINDGVTNTGQARTDATFDTMDRVVVNYATSDLDFYVHTPSNGLIITSKTDTADGVIDNAAVIDNYFSGGHHTVEILQTNDGAYYLTDIFPVA